MMYMVSVETYWVMFNIEDPTVTVKCRTAIKAMFLYLNLCPSVVCLVSHFQLHPFLLTDVEN